MLKRAIGCVPTKEKPITVKNEPIDLILKTDILVISLICKADSKQYGGYVCV
jgi:hypothetical protein